MTASIQPDISASQRFLAVLDARGIFTFQTFDDGPQQRERLAHIRHSTFDECAARLSTLNETGAGIFVMVNEGDLKGRKAENVTRVRALFVDLDGAPLEPVVAFPLRPHIIVNSSPERWHAYWLVSDCSLDQFAGLQTRLAQRFQGDTSIKDLPRVMRLPGFFHRKREPVMTTIQAINAGAPYTVQEIEAASDCIAPRAVVTSAIDSSVGVNVPFLSGVPDDPSAPCEEGERNNRAAKLAGSLIAQGKTDDEVLCGVLEWNAKLSAPLDEAEIRAVCQSIRRTHENKRATANHSPAAFTTTPCPLVEWDEPIPFSDVVTPDIPAVRLPGALGAFAHALATATETPEAMAVMTILGVVSVAAAKRFFVSPKPGWLESVNIYTLIALPPGNNKSLVLRGCTEPLVEWEIAQAGAMQPGIERQRSERKTLEKIIESRRSKVGNIKDLSERHREIKEITELDRSLPEPKVLPRLFATDTTPEALAHLVNEQGGRFAVITDEGGIIEALSGLYTGGAANIDVLLKGIDGGHIRVQRKDRSFNVNPYLTLLLVVQPKIIQNMSGKRAFQGNGLLERFLYVLPQSMLGFRIHDTAAVSPEVRQAYHQAVRALLDIPPLMGVNDMEIPRVLKLAPDAFAQWHDIQRKVEGGLAPGGAFQEFQGWGGKVCGYALRIAGLLHIAEYGERLSEISVITMEQALLIAVALIGHARAAFSTINAEPTAHDAQAIWNWIQRGRCPRFSKTECHREHHGRFKKVARLEAALSDLADRNIISAPLATITTPGKRRTVEYLVNPKVLG